ncbi:MAG: hypothetical protein ABI417_09160 [Coleofasciculaceae cyanobacterium]|jgi:hypothetical protein
MTEPQITPSLIKREYFASVALQGLLNNQYATKRFVEQARVNYELIPQLMAEEAVRIADALIARLEQ